MEIRPRLSLIAAMARNRVIGRNNRMPWHLPADLRHFKAMTLGKPMIMGRKTWESLPGLLPGRPHIVITGNPSYRASGVQLASSLHEAIEAAGEVEEIMVVGGGQLYQQAMPLAQRLYLTIIHADMPGDTYFPNFDWQQWQEIERQDHHADADNPYDFSFLTLQRRS